MVKMTYVIIAALVVVVLLIVGLAAFSGGLSSANGGSKAVTSPEPSPAASNGTVMLSALQALSVANKDANVTGWRSSQAVVYASDISSESSSDGLSNTWMITYILDSNQALVGVRNGAVDYVNLSMLKPASATSPELMTAGVIDSDRASSIASGALTSMGVASTGPASFELYPGEKNTSLWDIIYPVNGGYYLVRLNATSGQVIGTTQYNLG
jgi:hypothetical protein